MAKRVQVQDLNKVALNPQARPIDTFVTPGGRPPALYGGIAEALRGFNQNLDHALRQREERNIKEQDAAAEQRLASLSYDEAQALRQNGQLALNDDPWHIAAIDQYFGTKRADNTAQRILADIESNKLNVFELGQGGIEQALSDSIEQDLGDLQGTQGAVSYTRAMKQSRDRILAKTGEIIRAEDKRVSTEASFTNFKQVADEAIASGATPEQVFEAVRAQYEPTMGLYGLNYREQDDVLFNVLEHLASAKGGNYEAVSALLMTNRGVAGVLAHKDPDKAQRILDEAKKQKTELERSNAFGALVSLGLAAQEGKLNRAALEEFRADNPDIVPDTQYRSWIEQNEAVRQRKLEQLGKDQATLALKAAHQRQEAAISAKLKAMGESGGYHYVEAIPYIDDKGKEKEYTKQQIQDRMVEEHMKESKARVAAGEDSEAVFAEDAAWFAGNAAINPQWKDVLSNGFVGASPALLAGGTGELPPALRNAVALYDRLHAANPQLLDKHIADSSAKDFYDIYRIGRQNGGYESDEALGVAIKLTADPTHFEVASNNINKEMLENAADDALDGAKNVSTVKTEVARLATIYSATGISTEKAVELAAERITKTYTDINGFLVPTSDRTLPNNFPQMATYWIKEYARANELDEDSISLLPISSDPNHFLVVDYNLGILANPGGVNRVSVDDIKRTDEGRIAVERAKREERSRQHVKDEAARYDAIFNTEAPLSP